MIFNGGSDTGTEYGFTGTGIPDPAIFPDPTTKRKNRKVS
jgi:hypothetical protein